MGLHSLAALPCGKTFVKRKYSEWIFLRLKPRPIADDLKQTRNMLCL
jgi:hypothetical protein